MTDGTKLLCLVAVGIGVAAVFYFKKSDNDSDKKQDSKTSKGKKAVKKTGSDSDNNVKLLQTKLNSFYSTGKVGNEPEKTMKDRLNSVRTGFDEARAQEAYNEVKKYIPADGVSETGIFDLSTENAVKGLQEYLNRAQLANLPVTGVYDLETDKVTKWGIYND